MWSFIYLMSLNNLVLIHSLSLSRQSSEKLRRLVNNAGTIGVTGNEAAMRDYILRNASVVESSTDTEEKSAVEEVAETYELAEQCFQTDYFGSKRMIETFVPLLHLSDSQELLTYPLSQGMLKCVGNEWAISELSDSKNLTEAKVEEVINVFLKDFKEGCLEAKKWPTYFPTYAVVKACLNAYTRILAKQYPKIYINSVDPGHTQTDMSSYTGPLTVAQGAETPVKVALLPDGGPSGVFIVYEKVPSSVDHYPIMTLSESTSNIPPNIAIESSL
ncbi:hypothetical protein Leryth_010244 [Lithospermum erythrorhizon]|nr:hypothetical protein Leryth_010244 [Lithospermum erythrorhizon]